jgi:6-phosphogluconolactonase
MSRAALLRVLILTLMFCAALFFSACGSNSQNGGSGSGGSGSGGSGGSGSGNSGTTGNFAAGIGGAAQTSSAQFLIGVVPGNPPNATKINSDGTLTAAKTNVTSFSGNPEAAAIDPSGTFLYVASDQGLYGFTINRQTGDITQMPNTPVNGSQNFTGVAVDQLGKFVYAWGTGQVFGYTIQTGTGQLSLIAGTPVGSTGPFLDGAEQLAVSQNNKFLYVAADSGIMAYTIDPSSGALTSVAGSPFNPAGGGALAVVAPASGYVYESTQSAPESASQPPLYGFSIDQNTGALTAVAGSPFTPGCSAANLTSPASGNFLFASGCGMYQINPGSGALTFLFSDPEAGLSPWAVFNPTGNFIWEITPGPTCFACNTGVTAYQVDTNTGNMTMLSNSFFVMVSSSHGAAGALAITN